MNKQGFECTLIDSEAIKYDMTNQLYRHKLDVLNVAMLDYDEIIYLDWDFF